MDFGNSEDVEESDLRPAMHMDVPMQCYTCQIHNVAPVSWISHLSGIWCSGSSSLKRNQIYMLYYQSWIVKGKKKMLKVYCPDILVGSADVTVIASRY